jgi:hypothetical protein
MSASCPSAVTSVCGRRLAAGVGSFLLAPLVIAAVAAPAHAATCGAPTSLSAMTASSQSACWQPLASDSPFTTELPSSPALAANSSAVSQHMATYGWTLGTSSTSFSIGAEDGSRPLYFASSSDPTMTINCTSAEGPGTCAGTNGVDINGAKINVPAGAQPTDNGDAHMTVIETATGQEYDLWHASVSGSTITSATGAMSNVNTGNGTGGGGDAAGFALSAGLLRPSELASGQINHALVITVPCTNATGANVGYSYPAAGGWGEYCGQYWNESASNAPMLGQRFQLNMTASQIAASGAPAWQQTIMTALANYGAYIEDTNGSWHNEGMAILTQDPTSWTSLGLTNQWTTAVSALGGSGDNLNSNTPIPTSKLQLINTCVTQATCITNPTTPIANPTPPASNPVAVAASAPARKISSLSATHKHRGRHAEARAASLHRSARTHHAKTGKNHERRNRRHARHERRHHRRRSHRHVRRHRAHA